MTRGQRRNYRDALLLGALSGIAVTIAYLQWHYHQHVSWGLPAIAGIALWGVGLSLRAK